MNIQHILVPVDFSPGSFAAVEAAFGLAALTKADVELVHVWDHDQARLAETSFDVTSGRQVALLLRETRAHGLPMDEAVEFLAALADRGARFRATFLEGPAAEAILNQADESGADLIVMGTHGRTGLRHAVLGSVTEQVVRTSPIPVFTMQLSGMHRETRAAARRL